MWYFAVDFHVVFIYCIDIGAPLVNDKAKALARLGFAFVSCQKEKIAIDEIKKV